MNKIMAVMVCACIILAVIGCTKTSEPSTEPDTADVQPDAETADSEISGINDLDTSELDSEVADLESDLEDW